jgi:hypothetical protein
VTGGLPAQGSDGARKRACATAAASPPGADKAPKPAGRGCPEGCPGEAADVTDHVWTLKEIAGLLDESDADGQDHPHVTDDTGESGRLRIQTDPLLEVERAQAGR